jgi:hypothetical protein
LTGLNKTPCKPSIPFQQKCLRRNLRVSGEDKAASSIKRTPLAPNHVIYLTALTGQFRGPFGSQLSGDIDKQAKNEALFVYSTMSLQRLNVSS